MPPWKKLGQGRGGWDGGRCWPPWRSVWCWRRTDLLRCVREGREDCRLERWVLETWCCRHGLGGCEEGGREAGGMSKALLGQLRGGVPERRHALRLCLSCRLRCSATGTPGIFVGGRCRGRCRLRCLVLCRSGSSRLGGSVLPVHGGAHRRVCGQVVALRRLECGQALVEVERFGAATAADQHAVGGLFVSGRVVHGVGPRAVRRHDVVDGAASQPRDDVLGGGRCGARGDGRGLYC